MSEILKESWAAGKHTVSGYTETVEYLPEINQPVLMVEVTVKNEPNILLDKVREAVNVMKEPKTHRFNGIEAECGKLLVKMESKQYGNSAV